jgi:hypothetical protein
MKVYHIHSTRHHVVVFAETPAEAVAQALERGLINNWERPEAVEVPLPKGYRLSYDPLVGSMEQPQLPLTVDEPQPAPPHTVTQSGIKVYDDWRDNIVVDAAAPPLVWKAGRDTFGSHTGVPGRAYLASENSEAALSWNLFRTLEKAGRLDIITRPLGLEDEFQALYWYRPWDKSEPLPEINDALRQIEPRKGYQTEMDIMLKGRRYLVVVKASLGKPGAQLRTWERTGSLSVPSIYKESLAGLLADMSTWETTMRRFYQLLRVLLLANELARPERWNLEPHLLAIVNNLNRQARNYSHAQEFAHFQQCLRWPPRQTHLLAWQALFERAEVSFEPAVRPLLNHVKRLNYFQPPADRISY